MTNIEMEAHGEEHVGHVLFDSLEIRDDVDGFVDAAAFTCENGLVYAETTGRN